MVSQKSVAAAAGVSAATVSYVLSKPEKVAPRTRERVLQAIEELGYVRNEAARHLRAGRSRTVGFVAFDITNPYFANMLGGFESEAESHAMRALIVNSAESEQRETSGIGLMQELRAEGIVVAPLRDRSAEVRQLRRTGTSVVIADRIEPTFLCCSVACDDFHGGRLQGRHLLELGHRRIAFVGGPLSRTQVQGRLNGLKDGLNGTPVDFTFVETGSLSADQGRAAAERMAAQSPDQRPTAVACANDVVALGVLQGFTSAGIRVPQDVAIVGYDDIPFAGSAAIPLSSVSQPARSIGVIAAQLMFDEIACRDSGTEHEHRQVLVQPKLHVRATTRAAG